MKLIGIGFPAFRTGCGVSVLMTLITVIVLVIIILLAVIVTKQTFNGIANVLQFSIGQVAMIVKIIRFF